jgi:hypothetical protein
MRSTLLMIFITIDGCRQGAVKGPVRPEAPTRRGMFTLNSRDLRTWFSMISSTMMSFQKVMVKSCQVLHPCLSPDPVALKTKE